jgi:hypothetical protein
MISFVVLVAFETLVKASNPRGPEEREVFADVADTFLLLIAVGIAKGYNCCKNYVLNSQL